MELIMSELDRLHEIIDALPPQHIHALLTLLSPPQPISDEEFARRLAMAPEEEVDEGTAARIFAAEAERGEIVSHSALKQRLGMWNGFSSISLPLSANSPTWTAPRRHVLFTPWKRLLLTVAATSRR